MAHTGDTLLSDLFVPEFATELYQGYVMQDSLGLLSKLSGPGRPIETTGFDLLARGGQFVKKPLWKKISSPVTRRDLTSDPTAVSTKELTADSESGVIINLKLGPFGMTLGHEFMARTSRGEMEREIARQCADGFKLHLVSLICNALKGATAAFVAGASGASFAYDHQSSVWDNSTAAYATAARLAAARAEMGDRIDKITDWLMRSEVYQDILAAQLAVNTNQLGMVAAYGQEPGTILPVTICDDSALKTDAVASSSTKSKWYTYGLGAGAVRAQILKAPRFTEPQIVNNEEQQRIIIRGDADLYLEVPGMSYGGAANPSTSTLATSGSWTIKAQDHRAFNVVQLESNSATV